MQFLVNAATKYCVELAKDRQGCCIIQKCIAHASKEQRNRLLYSITTRALELAEDEYGYVYIYIYFALRERERELMAAFLARSERYVSEEIGAGTT